MMTREEVDDLEGGDFIQFRHELEFNYAWQNGLYIYTADHCIVIRDVTGEENYITTLVDLRIPK